MTMKTIPIHCSKSYTVSVGEGLLSRCGEMTAPLVRGRRALLVAGGEVAPLYGETALASLRSAGFAAELLVIPGGEADKTPRRLISLLEAAAERQLGREDVFLALGGGAVCDTVGLAAALYERGTGCVMLPCSLLAMVDASVGGKTAVDLPQGKNLMGAFSQPAGVLCDTALLASLPHRRYAEGMAEVIKMAFLSGADIPGDREEMIALCVERKRAYVEADEQDRGARRLLNLGHTLGHAAELASGYALSHGDAVAIGMATICRGAVRKGLCDPESGNRLHELLRRWDLPTGTDLPEAALFAALRMDKKSTDGRIAAVIPRHWGLCECRNMDFSELEALLSAGREEA